MRDYRRDADLVLDRVFDPVHNQRPKERTLIKGFAPFYLRACNDHGFTPHLMSLAACFLQAGSAQLSNEGSSAAEQEIKNYG